MVNATHRSLSPLERDAVFIVQEAGWAWWQVCTGAENLASTGIRSPDRPARSESLLQCTYSVHGRPSVHGPNHRTRMLLLVCHWAGFQFVCLCPSVILETSIALWTYVAGDVDRSFGPNRVPSKLWGHIYIFQQQLSITLSIYFLLHIIFFFFSLPSISVAALPYLLGIGEAFRYDRIPFLTALLAA